MSTPDRWLHLRHPRGFTDEQFELFRAHCRVWKAYVEAFLEEWSTLEAMSGVAPAYAFFEPVLSADRSTATLPLGGDWNLASRALFENGSAWMLSSSMPIEFFLGLEEGLTETINAAHGPQTSWRPIAGPPRQFGSAT